MTLIRINQWILAGVASLLVMGSVAVPYSLAQAPSAAAAQTAFEVVSIRPSSPSDESNSRLSVPQGTRVSEVGISLWDLIQMSFGTQQNQMSAPEWTKSQKFNIEAKTGSSTPLTYEQMKPLMQQLLADRFKLTYHHETKQVAGYALMVAKGGPKLTAAKEGASKGGNILRDRIDVSSGTMKDLSAMLSYPLGQQPVVDKTGIAGYYEIKLSFAPQDATDSALPSIFTAVQEQMGLRLEPAKLPVEVLVIDHVEKVPTEN